MNCVGRRDLGRVIGWGSGDSERSCMGRIGEVRKFKRAC